MLIVELAGPSGAGKSAIYAEMLKGSITPNPKPSLGEALAGLKRATRMAEAEGFASLVEEIASTATGERVEVRRSFLYRSYYKHLFARGMTGPAMVIDGGLIQRGLAVEQLKSAVPVDRFWRVMPLPDVCFMVSADRLTLEARNQARGGDHDRSWQSGLALDHFRRAKTALRARGLEIIDLDSELPAAFNADVALAAIRKREDRHAAA